MDADARRTAARDLVRQAIELSEEMAELLDRTAPVDGPGAAPDLREAVVILHNRLVRVELGLEFLLSEAEAPAPR